MRMRPLSLAGLVVSISLLASGQSTNQFSTTRPVSLRQCFDLALTRNLDLQIEHLNSEIAGFNLFSSYGVYVPSLSVRAEHDFIDAPATLIPKRRGRTFPTNCRMIWSNRGCEASCQPD